MARTARRQKEPGKENQAAETEEEAVGDNGTGEEEAEPEAEAQVDVRMKGPASAVRKAAGRLSSSEGETKPEPHEAEVIDDPIAEMLANPRNLVVVKRLKPREWNHQRTAGITDNYECPIDRDEIESDTFVRFGGKRYKATIHPNTAGGQAKILDAWTFGDDRIDPIVEEDGVVDNAEDSEVEVDDPFEIARNAIKRKMHFTNDKAQLREAQLALKELESSEVKDNPASSPDGRDGRIRELEDRLKTKDIEDRMNARFTPLEKSIGDLTSAMTRFVDGQSNKPPQDDGTKTILLEMIKSGDTRFNALMTNFTSSITNKKEEPKKETWKDMMGDLKTMKELFGSGDTRVKDLETRLMDLAFERLDGGGNSGSSEEEDPIKFAIKELSPTFRTYVEKKMENENKDRVREMSPEEKKAYFKKAAVEEAKKLEEKWKKEGYLIKAPPPGKKPIPPTGTQVPDQQKREAEARAKLGTSTTVEVKAADTTSMPEASAGSESAPAPEEQGEESDMGRFAEMTHIGRVEIPPGPLEEGYNRQQAVDFVLDAIRSEIKSRVPQDSPDETFVVGDALDRFDDELLFNIAQAESGSQLDEVLAPWADESKLSEIKHEGDANLKVKSYLERIIITLKDKWREKAAKPPAK